MKVGRNESCPCGSGKKFKKCCIDKQSEQLVQLNENQTARMINGSVDCSEFPPIINGYDTLPDLKYLLQENLEKLYFDDAFDPEEVVKETMEEYQKLMEKAEASLSEPYGVLLQEIKVLMANKNYESAIKKADAILNKFPESKEAQIYKDDAFFNLGNHPLLMHFSRVCTTFKKEKEKAADAFFYGFKAASSNVQKEIFLMIEDMYLSNGDTHLWQARYSALDLLKNIGSNSMITLPKEIQERADQLLLRALADDDGRVRNNAVACVGNKKGVDPDIDFFFSLYKTLQEEKDDSKKRAMARALLDFVTPMMDYAMRKNNSEYKKAIKHALQITNYNSRYYLASPEEKMRISLCEREIIGKKKV